MKIKYIIAFIGILFLHTIYLVAQNITTNLIVIKPSAYVSEWNKPTAGRLIIVNTPNTLGASVAAKIYGELRDASGNLLASSNIDAANSIELKSGPNLFNLDEVLQLDNLNANSPLLNLLVHTGKLKSGNYQLGVQVFVDSLNIYVPKTNLQYRNIHIASYQLPYLVAPANETTLDATVAKSVVIFRWTSLVPMPDTKVKYILQIAEMQEGQSPLQALQSNTPILEKTIESISQYIWTPNMYFDDSITHKFIWTIKAIDTFGNAFESSNGNHLGISEPAIFYIKSRNEVNKKNVDSEVEN